MKQRTRERLLLIAFGVCLYAALMNLSSVFMLLNGAVRLFMPLIAGGILAFILNVPMRGIENILTRFFEGRKKKLPASMLRMLSLLLTLAAIVVVIALVVTMVIPEIVSSAQSIYMQWMEHYPAWREIMQSYHINSDWLTEFTAKLDVHSLFSGLSGGASNMVQSVIGAATSTVSAISTGLLAFVIALYILVDKEVLERQWHKLLYAYVKRSVADRICAVAELINQKYSSFLSGQCAEACILGCLIFLAFSIFRLPYASVVAVLTAVTSFIPYIGAFLSCAVGALLILMVNPIQALLSIAVYQVTQFIENQFIYPKVVGGSVGLSSFWTLIAVILGGKLFGVLGMIFFIPLTSVLYTLVREGANQRLSRKEQHINQNDDC